MFLNPFSILNLTKTESTFEKVYALLLLPRTKEMGYRTPKNGYSPHQRHVDLFLMVFSAFHGNVDFPVTFRERQMCQKEIFKYSALTAPKNRSLLSTCQRPYQGEDVNRHVLNLLSQNCTFENDSFHLGDNLKLSTCAYSAHYSLAELCCRR